MALNIRLINPNQVFPISGRLAAHFFDDAVTAARIGEAYRNAEFILLNPARFPHADVETLEWLCETLFELSPTAALS
jgi:hypothetical protein